MAGRPDRSDDDIDSASNASNVLTKQTGTLIATTAASSRHGRDDFAFSPGHIGVRHNPPVFAWEIPLFAIYA
jgi:hypothetical protein